MQRKKSMNGIAECFIDRLWRLQFLRKIDDFQSYLREWEKDSKENLKFVLNKTINQLSELKDALEAEKEIKS